MTKLYQGRVATQNVAAVIFVQLHGPQTEEDVKEALADALGDAIGNVQVINSWDLDGGQGSGCRKSGG